MKRGIYLVANFKSQANCENLIYSIRASGCTLPIRLIHFGGEKIRSKYISGQVEFLYFDNFTNEAKQFIENLKSVLTECPTGYLYRYLAWFSDWEQFIYSDNDIVALCNWENMFEYLIGNDLVHADEEYATQGIYNYDRPETIKSLFGDKSLESAITAGHIVVERKAKMVDDINKAVEWFKKNPGVAKKHDQSLMHIASLLGNWKILNLCKSRNWLSSWAGDYKNTLEIIHKIQMKGASISHIHYSGSTPKGNLAIQDLLFSNESDVERLRVLSFLGIKHMSGYADIKKQYLRIMRFYNRNSTKK